MSQEPPARRDGALLAALIAPLFMALLGVSIVNVSLPAVQQGLDATTSQLQWVLSGYALTFGLMLVPAGRLGDLVGRRRLFLLGVAVFVVASLGASLAWSATSLNLWRVLMGVGSGLLNPQIVGLLQQHFHGAARARAFGVMGSFIGMAMALGPLLGGVLIGALGPDLGWRSIFGVNVPVGLVTLAMAWRWVPRDALRLEPGVTRRIDLDPAGVGIFGAAIVLLMLPFLHVTDAVWIWAAVPIAVGVGAAWLRWEAAYARGGGEPMVNVGLLRAQRFSYGTILITCYFVGLAPSWAVVAIYVQDGLGYSALIAALVTVPAALSAALSSSLGGRLVTSWGRPMVAWGIVVAMVGQLATGAAALFVGDHHSALWVLASAFVLVGVAQGFVIGPNQSLTLSEVPTRHGGAAGGVMQTGQRVGAAMGLAIGTGVLYAAEAMFGWSGAVMSSFAAMVLATSAALLVATLDARKRAQDPQRAAV